MKPTAEETFAYLTARKMLREEFSHERAFCDYGSFGGGPPGAYCRARRCTLAGKVGYRSCDEHRAWLEGFQWDPDSTGKRADNGPARELEEAPAVRCLEAVVRDYERKHGSRPL